VAETVILSRIHSDSLPGLGYVHISAGFQFLFPRRVHRFLHPHVARPRQPTVKSCVKIGNTVTNLPAAPSERDAPKSIVNLHVTILLKKFSFYGFFSIRKIQRTRAGSGGRGDQVKEKDQGCEQKKDEE
jgi:hypothetical protein